MWKCLHQSAIKIANCKDVLKSSSQLVLFTITPFATREMIFLEKEECILKGEELEGNWSQTVETHKSCTGSGVVWSVVTDHKIYIFHSSLL